jgi:transglutaminase-like putative cysteine protease
VKFHKLLLVLLLIPCLGMTKNDNERKLGFDYAFTVPVDASKTVDVFVPLARDDEHQTITSRTFFVDGNKATGQGEVRKDSVYGNSFWHLQLNSKVNKMVNISVKYEITRRKNVQTNLASARKTFFTKKEQKEFALFLKANKRVPIDGKQIKQVIKDINSKKNEPLPVSKDIYNYVVDNMEYKKVGTGWGNGDTFWACSEKFGNCTDFHALFTSLARSQRIPSRFEIGFPIPANKPAGKIGGYHCWVNFNLPDVGWVPIDASEAKKHPEKREMFFGTHPTDRIKFTVGRDLKLGKGHKSKPLNYFIYPHVEIDGKKLPKVDTNFSYKTI